MADLPPRSPWPKALAAGAALLAVGMMIGRHSKSGSGQYAGFWSGLTEPSAAPAALAACPTPKCLTVYVAPWCPHCRDATPAILTMRDFLNKNNVHTNIIVGLDQPKALAQYAKIFGPDTILDEKGELASGGVPHFFVTDKAGHLLRDQAGVPQDIPDGPTFAALLGLP